MSLLGPQFSVVAFWGGPTGLPWSSARDQLGDIDAQPSSPHFWWAPPAGVKPEEIDMSENNLGMVCFMRTPLQAGAKPRFPAHLYKRNAVDM
ncbi:hypothetical protein RHMOL_Rhmol04G0075100 [Rhododendron molle]|uniref:Uncharacterized protein n=1 Tax=Rhododendron molle TaxID=49168 RepID=A0ACC0NYE0_RHOML|nr:hypothetical protein RHMOL_Rhmol04G0075100 [Rhododendron molle]